MAILSVDLGAYYSQYKWLADGCAGVAIGLITNLLWEKLSIRLPSIRAGQREDVAGIWVTRIANARHPDRKGIEIMRIRQRGGNLKFYIEHYRSKEKGVRTLAGRGVFTGKILSWFFYFTDKHSHASGITTCARENTELDPPLLKGVFTQIVDRADEKAVITEPYNCVKTKVPIFRQLRRIVGLSYFRNYLEADAFLSSLPPEFQSALHLPSRVPSDRND